MTEWIATSLNLIARSECAVLITVCVVEGSAPRAAGVKMLISPDCQTGTIGGGNLEYIAVQQARKMLARSEDGFIVQDYPLGPLLGQCCGGYVRLLLEKIDGASAPWLERLKTFYDKREGVAIVSTIEGKRLRKHICPPGELGGASLFEAKQTVTARGPDGRPLESRGAAWPEGAQIIETHQPAALHITLFGAGHVGRAMCRILGGLDAPVTWVDSRPDMFPRKTPGNIKTIAAPAPVDFVETAPPSSAFFVFTHAHDLDFEITAAILSRGDFFYCGLIGSKTKRARFESRLKERGVEASALKRLTCPIGGAGSGGKSPDLIAIAAVAELLALSGTDS